MIMQCSLFTCTLHRNVSRDSDQLTKEQYQHVTVYYTPNLISNNNGENSPRATNDFSFDAAKIVSTKLDVT